METKIKAVSKELCTVDVQALASTLGMESLRIETKGQCDKVDPNSLEGIEYSRLLFSIIEVYKEVIKIHSID